MATTNKSSRAKKATRQPAKKATRQPAKKTTKKAAMKTKKLGTCFVMMPFKEPFDLYYEAIFKPAIDTANLDPIRADDLFRPSIIVSDLWQMIQNAKVC